MGFNRSRLLSTTSVPVLVGAAMMFFGPLAGAGSANPCAVSKRRGQQATSVAQNPCAAKRGCNPCNPRAAKRGCNPCNPCAAKKNPCNPCGASNPCNPCNPCAGGAAFSSRCVVPRLQVAARANPCAAKRACNPCNPCRAKACNPCNPCAAKRACNPCNPCAAKNPCNPCAARNPCADKRACNPCNPCAAKNPCNPCGGANPCNPCAGGKPAPKLTVAEAGAAYDCMIPEMVAAYAKSGDPIARNYRGWGRFSTTAYQSDTHGLRYVQNYSNKKAYGKFEEGGNMPVGTLNAKDSFVMSPDGRIGVGPLFTMEKKASGWNAGQRDWKYSMIMPNGAIQANKAIQKFCNDCHSVAGKDDDHQMFLPDEFRVSGR